MGRGRLALVWVSACPLHSSGFFPCDEGMDWPLPMPASVSFLASTWPLPPPAFLSFLASPWPLQTPAPANPLFGEECGCCQITLHISSCHIGTRGADPGSCCRQGWQSHLCCRWGDSHYRYHPTHYHSEWVGRGSHHQRAFLFAWQGWQACHIMANRAREWCPRWLGENRYLRLMVASVVSSWD